MKDENMIFTAMWAALGMIAVAVVAALAMSPAMGQSFYKCPHTTPGAPPVIQQMPCSVTGGGETLEKKQIKTTGADLKINEQGRAYMDENKDQWAAQREAQAKEAERQESLNVERDKARAAEDQAAAQRATARAIWATGRRW